MSTKLRTIRKTLHHPLRPTTLSDEAREHIYGVVQVIDEGATSTSSPLSLQSTTVAPSNEAWVQLQDHIAIGSVTLGSERVLTGLRYTWPYPIDQAGEVVMVATQEAAPTALPTSVWFVRAAEEGPIQAGDMVDGVTVLDGDRILQLQNDEPETLLEWDTASHNYLTTVPSGGLPDGLLVVVEDGGRNKGVCWWMSNGRLARCRVLTRSPRSASGHTTLMGDIDLTQVSGTATTATHVFVLLLRAANRQYTPSPNQVTTNMYTFPWDLPVDLTDGKDRVDTAGLTDGLIVFGHWSFVSSVGHRSSPRHSSASSSASPFASFSSWGWHTPGWNPRTPACSGDKWAFSALVASSFLFYNTKKNQQTIPPAVTSDSRRARTMLKSSRLASDGGVGRDGAGAVTIGASNESTGNVRPSSEPKGLQMAQAMACPCSRRVGPLCCCESRSHGQSTMRRRWLRVMAMYTFSVTWLFL